MSKKQPKLTPWFPGDVKPARVGVYQQFCGLGDRIGYQRWDGRAWHLWAGSPEEAAGINRPATSSAQNDTWRGLAVKP